jgi:small subunit ribosomal protein S8
MFNDPISDLLTRIRNAQQARKAAVVLPHSKLKQQVAEILQENGFVDGVKVAEHEGFKSLEVTLKPDFETITSLQRVSKPGRRVYSKAADIPVVLGGRGLVIVSTSAGVMTGRQAHRQGLGGELICKVW